MRLIVFSDTHQNTELLRCSLRQAAADGPVDVLLHCGDGIRDLDAVENEFLLTNPTARIYAVRGNCDLASPGYPATELFEANGVKAMATHGHAFHVKQGLGLLVKAARESGADMVFFGHTHQPLITEKHNLILINPGSLASYAYTDTAYLEILIDSHRNVRENFIKRSIKQR